MQFFYHMLFDCTVSSSSGYPLSFTMCINRQPGHLGPA